MQTVSLYWSESENCQLLNIIGTLGLIVKARERGIITSVAAILDRLENADFRISQNLKNNILEIFGE